MAQKVEISATNAPLQVFKISESIIFDGLPDEEVWQSIPALPIVMFMPVPGNEPTENSIVRLAYDDEYFYVSCFLYYKDPKSLRAIGKKRDYNSRLFNIIQLFTG